MGYPATAQMPKVFFGLLGKWHKDNNYSYEVILETMYYCDVCAIYPSHVAAFGGIWYQGSGAGVFCLDLYPGASAAYSYIGAKF